MEKHHELRERIRRLRFLNEERIREAEKSLKEMLEVTSSQEKSFLDMGSGSGLFSLAASRLHRQVEKALLS